MTHLILIRHGETDWNHRKCIQGQTDIPLNAAGLRQAQQLSQCLAQEPIAAVLSSDLQRAVQTAEPIAARHALPVTIDTGFRERLFGIFEGLTADDIKHRHPDDFRRWQAREWNYVIPQGESLAQLYARIEPALIAAAERFRDRRIVLVTHGGVLDCIYRIATGLPSDAPRQHPLLNAAINRVHYDAAARAFSVIEWGNTAHLDAPPRALGQRTV